MSLEAARNLSIPDLLRVLDEKLGLEYVKLRESRLPPVASITSLESRVESLETRAQDILKLIRYFRNLLRPVNRLPLEIFSRIIRYVPGELAVDAHSIVKLTHVCRYWRESIISTPENWTLISSWHESLTALSLERCKAAPLKFNFRMDEIGWIPGFSDLIMPYIRNTKAMRVDDISSVEELMQMLPNFPQSMPNLRSLQLLKKITATGDRGESIDPFGPFAPTLGYLKLVSFPLYPSLLRLRSLTGLVLYNERFDLRLDTLLDFLEENRSLESVILNIKFTEPSLRSSQRPAVIGDRLRYLLIEYRNAVDGKALISNIALRRGVQLEIGCCDRTTWLDDLLSGIPATQLPSLSSPTSIGYGCYPRLIRLLGPNGGFSFGRSAIFQDHFTEFPLLPLASVRKFHLIHHTPWWVDAPITLVFPPSFFPALETFTVDCDASMPQLLSTLLSNPSSLPSLKTLAFLNCNLSPDFMEALIQFASNRKNTASTWLHRIIIVNSSNRKLPSVSSIEALEKYVPSVDVNAGEELPVDLVWRDPGRFTKFPISVSQYGYV